MKKIILPFFVMASVLLTGCFDTVEEITINEDGSGTISATTDMSAIVGLLKQMGEKDMGNDEMDKAIDSTFSMASEVDADTTLTDAEKNVLKTGRMRINMDMENEKMILGMSFPFSKMDEITRIKKLSAKVMDAKMAAAGEGAMAAMGGDDAPKPSSFDDYFETAYSNGLLVKTVNKEKYANVDKDEYLKGMEETAAMGLSMTAKYIINLPRPATKVEGKSVKVSGDKKQLTITVSLADFFADPANLEYRIEY